MRSPRNPMSDATAMARATGAAAAAALVAAPSALTAAAAALELDSPKAERHLGAPFKPFAVGGRGGPEVRCHRTLTLTLLNGSFRYWGPYLPR